MRKLCIWLADMLIRQNLPMNVSLLEASLLTQVSKGLE